MDLPETDFLDYFLLRCEEVEIDPNAIIWQGGKTHNYWTIVDEIKKGGPFSGALYTLLMAREEVQKLHKAYEAYKKTL